jgi:hypothetical protein
MASAAFPTCLTLAEQVKFIPDARPESFSLVKRQIDVVFCDSLGRVPSNAQTFSKVAGLANAV